MTTGTQADPQCDLDAAIAVVAEMGRLIAAADTKTGLVLATQGVVLAATATALRPGAAMSAWSWVGAVVVVVAVVVLVLLLAALWPRTGGRAPEWFAFTAFAPGRRVPARPDTGSLAESAWSQAAVLAGIARRKFRWFRSALVIAAVELVAFGVWVTLGVAQASTP